MKPSILGLKKSFGFGDRLGVATPGHLAAARNFGFAPIFAQQSIREMERTARAPHEVMSAAQTALAAAGYEGVWGADADHLKTPRDIEITAQAGFTFFTIDPSAGVNNRADTMSESELNAEWEAQIRDGLWDGSSPHDYEAGRWDIGTALPRFDREAARRAVAKYGRAVALAGEMAAHIARVMGRRAFEIEVSVDETDAPTSPLEHLFFALELKRRGVQNLVSLAPRFVGEMEKGIDYKGDLTAFERELKQHAAIAQALGPYKISVHSGSDKFAIYPLVGRVCGELLHVKTAGTSYLEALRVVARTDAALFLQIAAYAHQRFDSDRRTYHISTTFDETQALARRAPRGADAERFYLDERVGRQLLHVTFGSVLTRGRTATGRSFKDALLENLHSHDDLHAELLEAHFTRHLQGLTA